MSKITKFVSPFAQKVYALTKRVPTGKVTTYKAIAKAMRTKAYRAVGQALSVNPYAPNVPCHRVVASDGRLNGFNGSRADKELNRKTKLLKQEGLTIQGGYVKNFGRALFQF